MKPPAHNHPNLVDALALFAFPYDAMKLQLCFCFERNRRPLFPSPSSYGLQPCTAAGARINNVPSHCSICSQPSSLCPLPPSFFFFAQAVCWPYCFTMNSLEENSSFRCRIHSFCPVKTLGAPSYFVASPIVLLFLVSQTFVLH